LAARDENHRWRHHRQRSGDRPSGAARLRQGHQDHRRRHQGLRQGRGRLAAARRRQFGPEDGGARDASGQPVLRRFDQIADGGFDQGAV